MSDFDDYPFSLPQNWGKRMDFLKFFFTSEDKILETFFSQVFVDYFLASHYASLTTKSSHFVVHNFTKP